MVTWGMTDEEVDLSSMYDVLRQQFQNTNDPWVRETIQWWDRFVPMLHHQTACSLIAIYPPAKFFRLPPAEVMTPMILGIWRALR